MLENELNEILYEVYEFTRDHLIFEFFKLVYTYIYIGISLIWTTFLWSFAGPSNNVCHTIDNKPCRFPFRYNGVSYSTCTLVAADEENKAWCSTLVDEEGNHVSGGGHYGDCGPKCPFPGRWNILKMKTWLTRRQKTLGYFSRVKKKNLQIHKCIICLRK